MCVYVCVCVCGVCVYMHMCVCASVCTWGVRGGERERIDKMTIREYDQKLNGNEEKVRLRSELQIQN